jgi:hypothetical protein
MFLNRIFSGLIFVCLAVVANAESIPGCDHLRSVQSVIGFSGIDVADADTEKIAVKQAYRALCSPLTPEKGASVYYPNGKTATFYARTEGATWYYPNGRVITSYAGRTGASWYYPNGKIITFYMGQNSASWYHFNGAILTFYFGQKGSSWYYANGKLITNYAGTKGATWYYSNGASLSSYFGSAGATWYHENGSTWTSSGPELSESALLYPHLLLARLFERQEKNSKTRESGKF